MALLSVIAAAALIYVGIMGRGLSTGHPQPDLAGAVVMFSFAALSMAVLRRAVIQLRSGSLRLDETGFEFAGYRSDRYLWSDVGDFRVERGGKFENVGFRVRPPKDDPDALLNLRFFGFRIHTVISLKTWPSYWQLGKGGQPNSNAFRGCSASGTSRNSAATQNSVANW